MEAPCNIEELIKDLAAFRANMSFHLTAERPLPPDLAKHLWNAHDTVVAVLESLRRQYDVPEGGWTVYVPDGSNPTS